jgi:PAS domain S-box-containing protein
MAELSLRWALFGWLGLLIAFAVSQAYLGYAALVFSGALVWSTAAFLALSLIVAYVLQRRIRRLEDARAELGLRLRGAEWERDTLRAVLESSPDAVAIVDAELRPLLDNRRFGEWFGVLGSEWRELSPDEAIGRLAARIADPESFQRWIGQLRDSPERIERQRVNLVEGSIREVDCYTAPLRAANGVIFGRLFSYRDVSRETEDARAKGKLVSTVSHELRTPLASVVGLAELLVLRDHPKAERQRYLRVILDESHRLTSIIDEFLNLHRVRTESLETHRDSTHRSEANAVGGRF